MFDIRFTRGLWCLGAACSLWLSAPDVQAQSVFRSEEDTAALLAQKTTVMTTQQAQAQLLEVEALRGYPAIFRLRELMQQSDAVLGTLPGGREAMRVRLVQALLDAFPQEMNPERRLAWLDEIEQHMALMPSPTRKVWVAITLLQRLDVSEVARVQKSLEAAMRHVADVPDVVLRSQTAAALAETILRAPAMRGVSAEEIQAKTQTLLAQYIRTARQRAVVVQLLAQQQMMTATAQPTPQDPQALEAQAEALLAQARTALDGGNVKDAMRLALAAQPKKDEARQKLLKEIAGKAMEGAQLDEALHALYGIRDANDQNEALKKLAMDLLEKQELPWASSVAVQIDEGMMAAQVWLRLAKTYQKSGYETRMQEVQEQAWQAALRITKPSARSKAFAMLAKELASQKSLAHVPDALRLGKAAKEYPQALGMYIVRLAGAGQIEKAQEYLKQWPQKTEANKDLYEWDEVDEAHEKAVSAIAKALAEKDELSQARELYDGLLAKKDAAGAASAFHSLALAMTKAYVRAGKLDAAKEVIAQMSQPDSKAVAITSVLMARYKAKEPWANLQQEYAQAVDVVMSTQGGAYGEDDPVVRMSELLLDQGLLEPVRMLEKRATVPATIAGVRTKIARYFAFKNDVKAAREEAEKIEGDNLRDAAYAALSDALVRANHIRDAVAVIQKMKGDIARVQAFHSAARTQAYRTDFYGLLKGFPGNSDTMEQLASPGNMMHSPSLSAGQKPSAQQVSAFEEGIVNNSRSMSEDVLLSRPLPSSIGATVPPLNPEALQVNESRDSLAKRLPSGADFRVAMVSYDAPDAQQKFVASLGLEAFSRGQNDFAPEVILLHQGVADLSALYLALRAQGYGNEVIEKQGRTYTLRRPLVIAQGASMVISGADTLSVRLSVEAGAYIVNAGTLYVQDTTVVGWNEAAQAAQWAQVEDKLKFRPFITSWSLSHTYMGGSVFAALGYSDTKAYGISLTSGPKDLVQFKPTAVPRPDGILAENSFRNIYYGFYSFEADHVALIGNEYKDNIIYGIDPHDRSRFLTIAFNTAWGAYKKHGIIISREVNDTSIIGNITFKNHGSGFMMDRLSIGTMIYANTAFDNGQDGLTVYESDCKLIASNRFFGNDRDGLKVRNSRDIGAFYNVLYNNKRAGIEGYTGDLRADPSQAHRDFELDPYSTIVAFNAVGNWIEGNKVGVTGSDIAAVFLKNNYFTNQSPKLFGGTWFKSVPQMMSQFDLGNEGVAASQRCPGGTVLPQHEVCKFRKDGYFTSDGQDRLYERVNRRLCEVRS